LLRPNGFIRVGLYSEIARARLEPARAFITKQGYRPTADDIRRFRQDLSDRNGSTALQEITQFNDFFSTSECRDMLFHVQEHRFAIRKIKSMLAENRLDFIGFELSASTLRHYGSRFPEDTAMTDLDLWSVFETEHPATFIGMYNFWAQNRLESAFVPSV